MIPLTLRAMNRMPPHPIRNSGRPLFALISVLALLALACFPVFAQAEIQYEDEVPDINAPTHKKDPVKQSDPKAGSSDSGETGGAVAPGGSGDSGGSVPACIGKAHAGSRAGGDGSAVGVPGAGCCGCCGT